MMPDGGGRARPDKRAIAAKAALACVEDGVTLRDAMGRFQIGWTLLRQAVAKLRAERAAVGAGSSAP